MMLSAEIRRIGIVLFFLAITAFFTSCSSAPKHNTADESPASEQPTTSAQVDNSLPGTAAPAAGDSSSSKLGDNKYQSLRNAVRGGNAEAIREEAGKVLSSNANDSVALNTLALYYFRKNKLGSAKLLMSRAFEKNPELPALYNNLGVIELAEGDKTAAIANFKKALRLDDRHIAASGNLGSIYVNGGEYSRAQGLLETAYRGNKANAAVANNYAITLRASKDYSKAAKVYEEIIKSSPRDVNALLNYSILLIDFMSKPKDGLALVYKLKFLETENRDIVARANALEKKAKAEIK